MAQGQRCPQGPANWGPKALPDTPKLRINSQILPCSLPSGTIPNKGRLSLCPQARWGLLCLSAAACTITSTRPTWLSTTAEPTPSEASQDGAAGGRAVCAGRVREKFSAPNPGSLVSPFQRAQFPSVTRSRRRKCFLDNHI